MAALVWEATAGLLLVALLLVAVSPVGWRHCNFGGLHCGTMTQERQQSWDSLSQRGAKEPHLILAKADMTSMASGSEWEIWV